VRKVLFFLLLINGLILFPSRAQDHRNVELLDQWTDESIIVSTSMARYNDCWVFAYKEHEYAVLGSTMGTHLFAITDKDQFQNIGFVEGNFSSTQVIHRDYKSYKNYLYAVCDEGPSKLQIIDLSNLPHSIDLAAEIDNDFGRVHNLFIDTTHALLYAFILTTIENGLPTNQYAMRVFSLADPLNPQLVYTGPSDIPEVHDGYVRNNIAILNCGFDGLRVYDFSNPSSPLFLQNMTFYQDQGYNHQGWLNPAGDTYVFGDETNGKRLKLCEKNAQGEWVVTAYFGSNILEGSIPHNIMLDDHYAYVAYYNYGLRIYDYRSRPVRLVAYYDTYNQENAFKMNGAWGIYSGLPSKRIVASDRQNGLFLLSFNRDLHKIKSDSLFTLYPNPIDQNDHFQIQLNDFFQDSITVSMADYQGKKIEEYLFLNQSILSIPSPNTAGVYFVKIRYRNRFDAIVEEVEKLVVY
jgi:choice-of-anchor B domain-containing protein